MAVRYQPAAEAAEVGGDWYDAFIQPGGANVLVIGDVAGHDADAAAAMGQLRAIVRTLGASNDDGPAAILVNAERVMTTLAIQMVATAVVARLEESSAEQHQGLTTLRWSNAGHPALMVIHSDGTVAALHPEGVDLLLGVRLKRLQDTLTEQASSWSNGAISCSDACCPNVPRTTWPSWQSACTPRTEPAHPRPARSD